MMKNTSHFSFAAATISSIVERLDVVGDEGTKLRLARPRIRHLVADEKQVALDAALLERVAARAMREEYMAFWYLSSYEPPPLPSRKIFVMLSSISIPDLELTDLERRILAVDVVADRAEEHLRVLDVTLPEKEPHQLGKIALHNPRHARPSTVLVEDDGDRERVRVLLRVARPSDLSVNVERVVDLGCGRARANGRVMNERRRAGRYA